MTRDDYRGNPRPEEYLDVLRQMHRKLRPRTYVEVGVSKGKSLSLVGPRTIAIGVDPSPRISYPIRKSTRVLAETSDHFFEEHDVGHVLDGHPIDIAFIDGMHLFEFAFRDFVNIEAHSSRDTIVLVHDCLPRTPEMASIVRTTGEWTGDVWKLLLCLADQRPDLSVKVIDAGPTGLGLIRKIDPQNVALRASSDDILKSYSTLKFGRLSEALGSIIPLVAPDWDSLQEHLPQEPFPPSPWPRSRRALPRDMPRSRRVRIRFSHSKLAVPVRAARDAVVRDAATRS